MVKSQWIRTINAGFVHGRLNPSKKKDREGEWSFKVLAPSLQKVGFEVVKCDKHTSLDQLDRTAYRSRHGTDD